MATNKGGRWDHSRWVITVSECLGRRFVSEKYEMQMVNPGLDKVQYKDTGEKRIGINGGGRSGRREGKG